MLSSDFTFEEVIQMKYLGIGRSHIKEYNKKNARIYQSDRFLIKINFGNFEANANV